MTTWLVVFLIGIILAFLIGLFIEPDAAVIGLAIALIGIIGLLFS